MDRTRQRNGDLVDSLGRLVGDFLGREPGPGDIDVPLLELGANSLMMMEISRAVERRFATRVAPRRLMGDLSTVAALAAHIEENAQESAPAPFPPSGPLPVEEIRQAAPLAPIPAANPMPPATGDLGDVFAAQIRAVRRALDSVVAEQLAFLRNRGAAPPLAEAVAAAVQAAPAVTEKPPPTGRPSVLPPWKVAEIRARGLKPAERAHLEGLSERYNARTATSKCLAQAGRRVLADNRASAGFRFSLKEILYPLIGTRAKGAHLWDADDNRYVDITMGFGVNLFGHHPEFLAEAMTAQFERGIQIGPQTALAGEVAQRFTRLTGKERVAFFNTGSEAVMIALRLARAATGRNKVALFSGSYHGQSDIVLGTDDGDGGTMPLAPGILPGAVGDLLILEYGADASLEAIRAHRGELAAVLVEPVQSRRPDLQPAAFLHALRDLTRETGIPLIFDEMITGFRLHPQGAQGWYGVAADIATYGKVIGGGLPIGIVAGSAAYMDAFDGGFWQYGDASYPAVDTTFSAGTFNKHPLTLAAAKAVLDHLEQQGPALQERLNARTHAMIERLNTVFEASAAPIKAVHCGSQFRFVGTGNLELFFHHLIEHGVFVWEGRNCFLSSAHSDGDVEHIVEASAAALEHLRGGTFLPAAAEMADLPCRLPLTEAQRQLVLLADMDPDGARAYTVSAVLDLEGRLDVGGMERALGELIRRHEALRTTVCENGWTQRVAPAAPIALAAEDVGGEAAARDVLAAEVEAPFDLRAGPLFRVRLLRLAPERHWLVLRCHHVVSDGLSMAVIVDDLGRLYATDGAAAGLPPAPPFAEFIRWHLCERPGEAMRDHETFWRRELAEPPGDLQLPCDRLRPATRTFCGERRHRRLPASLVERLDALARARQATRFMVLLAVHLVHLHRLTGQNDIVVGVPVAGRGGGDWGRMVGYCTHLLPVRSRFDGNLCFADFLARTKDVLFAAYEHEDYPFARMANRLDLARDPSRPPLLSTVFNIDRPIASIAFAGLAAHVIEQPIRFTAYDFAVNVLETDDAVSLEVDYKTDLFDTATIDGLVDRYLRLLDGLAADPARRLDEMPLTTPDERATLLETWGDGGPPAATETTVVDLLARRAGMDAAVAADDGAGILTYADLARRADVVVRALAARGIAGGDFVALDLAAGCDRLTAFFGILRAGAVAVPLDPEHPAERRRRIAADCGARLTIGSELGFDELLAAGKSRRKLPRPPAPADLAYVVYTSGSTGEPKGVAVAHGALANLATAQAERLALGIGDRLLQVTSPAFDVSIGDLVTAIAAGATLCFADRATLLPGPAFIEALRRRRITHAQIPASYLAALGAPPDLPDLGVLVIGGEAIPAAVAVAWAEGRRLVNAYGPSEATITATMADVRGDEGRLPIGTPLPGVRLYVVDEGGSLLPPGAVGELWIGGCGVSRGYVGRDELTARAFGDDPFAAAGARIYRTGDLVRWRTDGRLEFVGRRDSLVKLRGMRIELGEIEAVLSRVEGVREVAADVRGSGPGAHLVAWIVAENAGAAPAVDLVKARLRETLPATMVPSAICTVDRLPRSASGKIDRASLAEPPASAEAAAGTGPRDDIEHAVAAVWSAVLERPAIDIHANFFDLGGHSLLVPQVQARLQARLGRAVPITELFRHPTVAELAAYLGGTARQISAPVRIRPSSLAGASDAIAIVGMAGRFPGADDVDSFWRMLRDGVEAITRFDRDALIAAGTDPHLVADPSYVPAHAVLAGVGMFDAGFFGYSPREAAEMDPQHRLLLELAWEAMENAGYGAVGDGRRVGVFAGVGVNAYAINNLLPHRRNGSGDADLFQLFIGNDKDFAPTRIAYKLGLEGPALSVNTACSTSLTATRMACQALRASDCDMALAGGVSIAVPQERGYLHQEGAIDSPDGHCRVFDADAEGTVSGNGGAIVVLKRLDDALADGDMVLAVIRGGAMNNDGNHKAGFTAPSQRGQAAVVGDALAEAEVAPETIGYVEAHGTGTRVGDPIEIAALNEAFAATAGGPLAAGSTLVGSVKSNIGHLDAGAGVAGLVKTVQALRHGEIPPSLHYRSANPRIDFAAGPFRVADRLQPWPDKGGTPRRAGVSSFGIGGTNVHLVLEEAPLAPRNEPAEPSQLLVLSAATPTALDAATERLAARMEAADAPPLADAAFTLQVGRSPLAYRRAVVVRDGEAMAAALRDPSRRNDGRAAAEGMRVAMLFPGQGTQYPGMARRLHASEPVFRDVVERACAHLEGKLEHDLRSLLLAAPDDPEAAGLLRRTSLTQPALFVVEAALVELWRSWGVVPDAMVGHSIGEFVAAWVAGVFGFEDALDLVAQRAKLMQDTPSGAMLGVEMGEAELGRRLGDDLSKAAVNGPGRCVVAGTEEAVAALEGELAREGVATSRLHTTRAFHSHLMAPALAPFGEAVGRIALKAPNIPFISNVTGDWITAEQATDPGYWVAHLKSPVCFGAAIEILAGDPRTLLLEAGPGRTLVSLARAHGTAWGPERPAIHCLPAAAEAARQDARETMLAALGGLWCCGFRPDWKATHGGTRRRVPLPTYPFERTRHWVEPPTSRADGQRRSLGRLPPEEWLHVPVWTRAPAGRNANHNGPWRLIADGKGFAGRLEAALAARGQRVTAGKAAAANGEAPIVVDLRPLDAAGSDFAIARRLAFDGPLETARSVADGAAGGYVAVVANTYDVTGGEPLAPEGALVAGIVHALAHEADGVSARLIDLGDAGADRLADELVTGQDAIVALRGRHRWLPGTATTIPDAAAPRFKRGGVYVILGGFGRLGRIVARHLAERFAAKLVLIGRPLSDAAAERKVFAAELAADGDAVAVEADLTDADALAAAFAAAERRFGRIDGLVSCAGRTGPRAFAPLADGALAELAVEQFAAKGPGLAVLERALADRAPDFCVLFSSLAGRVGGVGLAGYAAANAYADAFVRAHNRRSSARWLSAVWDAWVLPDEPMPPGYEEQALTPADGCAALERLVAVTGVDEVLVLPTGRLAPRPAAAKPPAAAAPGGSIDPPKGTAEESVAGVFADVLGHAAIGRGDDFFGLGGDSLMAVKAAARLRGVFGREVAVRDIFDAPTVADLAQRLAAGGEAANDREEGAL